MSQTYYQQQPATQAQQSYAADAPHTQAAESKHFREDPALYKYGEVPAAATGVNSWFDFSNAGYLKGLVLGAGVTLLLTNPTVQKAVVRSTVKLWSFIQGGVEEVKEQFHDIKAEMGQEE